MYLHVPFRVGPVSETFGHTKGMVGVDNSGDGGFWLIHSVPKYADASTGAYTGYVERDNRRARADNNNNVEGTATLAVCAAVVVLRFFNRDMYLLLDSVI